ncbi:hypothetical protein [Streptomyces aurantiacus]|uniref:hypothetical protein n=1 Tax=Streptomyces aurantiacus TaxID=47760 RepID=UPI0012FEBA61
MGQEGGRAAQGLGWQVVGQDLAYVGGGEVAFEPGGDTGGEVLGVGGREEEAGVFATEAREDVDGRPEKVRGGVRGLRYGGESAARGLLLWRLWLRVGLCLRVRLQW